MSVDMRVAMIVFIKAGGIFFPYSHYLVSKLHERGVDVSFWGNAGAQLPDGVTASYDRHPVFRRLRTYAPDLPRAYKGISASRANIVHIQHSTSPVPEILFTSAARRRGIKTIITAHDVLPHIQKRFDHAWFGKLYRSLDAMIVHAEQNRRTAIDVLGVPESKVHVIPLGDFMHFDVADAPTRQQALERLGYAPDTKLVLFFGAVRPDKGLDVLIRAFKEIARAEPRARLVSVGPVKGSEDEARELYGGVARSLDLEDRVDLRFGYIDDVEVPVYFAASAVVALPYMESTQSGVVQVAFATKRAVVASAVGGIPEVVDEGVMGRLVKPGDEAQLADAVLSYLGDVDAADEAGQRGYEKARREYSWDVVATKTIDLYTSLLGC